MSFQCRTISKCTRKKCVEGYVCLSHLTDCEGSSSRVPSREASKRSINIVVWLVRLIRHAVIAFVAVIRHTAIAFDIVERHATIAFDIVVTHTTITFSVFVRHAAIAFGIVDTSTALDAVAETVGPFSLRNALISDLTSCSVIPHKVPRIHSTHKRRSPSNTAEPTETFDTAVTGVSSSCSQKWMKVSTAILAKSRTR
jgi:hypothetical protein